MKPTEHKPLTSEQEQRDAAIAQNGQALLPQQEADNGADAAASQPDDDLPAEGAAERAGDAPAPEGPAFAQTLLRAVEERTRRAERGVLRSMAAQSGMDEEALSQMLTRAGAARDAQAEPGMAEEAEELATPEVSGEPAAPEPRDTRAELLGRRLIAAEVRRVGAELGLLDAEVALTLIPQAALTIGETGEVEGAREALLNLRARKGYLFGRAAGAWAQKLDGGGLAPMSGVEEAFYRKNPALRK